MFRIFRGRRKVQVAVSVAMLAGLLLGSVALFGVGVRQLFRLRRPSGYRLNMLTDLVPNRQVLARRLAAEARKRRLEINLSSRQYASLEGLKLVNAPNDVHLALVPGGVGGPVEFPQVRQVAALGTDPLHVMVRGELFEAATRGLASLRGHRINCGPPTSVLRVLARDVLRFSGLRPPREGAPGDFVEESISSVELLARADRMASLTPDDRRRAVAALPDAILFLSPLPSILARRLTSVAGYRLVALPFTEAYALDRLNLDAPDDVAGAESIDRNSIVATTIPPSLYGTDPPIPPEPCRTLGTRLLLVAHAPTDPEAIVRLLEVIHEGPLAGLVQATPPGQGVPQFEPHPGVDLYVRRHQPIFTPEFLGQLGGILGAVGAFGSGVVGLYGFLRIMQLRRFESYYQGVRRIALVARGSEDDPEAPLDPAARRAYLLDKLDDLKSEAVRDFAEGGLRGEGLLAGVVALVNDTRASLAWPRRGDAPADGHQPASPREPPPG
jgi:hypothetical protein